MRRFGDTNKPSAEAPTLHPACEGRKCAGRRARQRGNAILEGALIFLPMLAFFLGIIDVSLAIFIQSTLTTAAREGTRFAITYSPSYNGTSCVASESTCINSV